MELNNLTQERLLNLIDWFLVYYILNAYINVDIACFETKHRNGLIYILTYMEVKNNKIIFQFKEEIESSLLH